MGVMRKCKSLCITPVFFVMKVGVKKKGSVVIKKKS